MAASNPLDIDALRTGTITSVTAQKNDPDRVSVYIEGAFAFGLAVDVAVRAGLRKGVFLDEARQREIFEEEQLVRARRAALDFIAHRARTEEEVRRRLREKGFAEGVAEAAITRMRDLGYLDDEGYANAFVSARLTGRGHGPARLRSDLLRRGVSSALIEAALSRHVNDDELREAALEHARLRWERLSRETDIRRKRKKVMDYLARRGYDFDLIREAVAQIEHSESQVDDAS